MYKIKSVILIQCFILALVSPSFASYAGSGSEPLFKVSQQAPSAEQATVSSAKVLPGNEWREGAAFAHQDIPGMIVYGSHISGDADVGSITLRVKKGDKLFYRSGPTGGMQVLEFVGSGKPPVILPVALDWVQLDLSGNNLPAGEFTIKLSDNGSGWGEWSAIAIKRSAVAEPMFKTSIQVPSAASATVSTANVLPGNEWKEGAAFAHQDIPGMTVYGSHIHGDSDIGSISLRVKKGDKLFYRSGPTAGKQILEFVGSGKPPVILPVALDWMLIDLSGKDLPAGEFTIKISDNGSGWGEWSAIAVKQSDAPAPKSEAASGSGAAAPVENLTLGFDAAAYIAADPDFKQFLDDNPAVVEKAGGPEKWAINHNVQAQMAPYIERCKIITKYCDENRGKLDPSNPEHKASIEYYKDACEEGGQWYKICTDAVADKGKIESEEGELVKSGKLGEVTKAKALEFGILK